MNSPLSRSAWFDLPVTNLADAMSFYEGLLQWKYVQMENSPLADYVMIQAGDTFIGGLRRVPAPRETPMDVSVPILYFTVEKLKPMIDRAKELGAQIVGQTVTLGQQRGAYQWIRDREGNVIGLWAAE